MNFFATKGNENILYFVFKGDVCPLNNKYAYRTNKYLSKRYRVCKAGIGWTAKIAMKNRPLFQGNLKVRICFWGRGDIDAYNKVILDSMEGIVYENDRQIIEQTTIKSKGKNKLEVMVEKM